MKITARVRNGAGRHVAEVETAGVRKAVSIPAKNGGSGSSINGGELLFLALATCYCNDVYREAGKRGIAIEWVEVDVRGEFGGEGEGAHHRRRFRGGAQRTSRGHRLRRRDPEHAA